jgi:hypothetical protein
MSEFIVIRTDKHSQVVKRMTVMEAILELASIMPASIYDSKQEIAIDLGLKGHIETLGYMYELSAGRPKGYRSYSYDHV